MDSYEQKYKEALERAKAMIKVAANQDEAIGFANTIFPELKDSEDERIRKAIVATIHLYYGEPLEDEAKEMIAWLEKQGEQKPIDKVEPKFHEGEWIISKYMHLVMQILNNDNGSYKTLETDGTERNDSYDFIERNFKLWTIKDAKDGDVLSDGTTIFIFKDLLSDGSVMSYCDYDTDSGESDAFCPLSVNLMCSKITPTTKEQRDILFQKMHEAGWEFDFDKKVLKKIEQEPTDNDMKELLHTEYEKGRADAIAEMQKPTWCEDDEKIGKELIGFCIKCSQGNTVVSSQDDFTRWVTWLKSLKERYTWKPSDEQMKALKYVAYHLMPDNNYREEMFSLYEQLKKLK